MPDLCVVDLSTCPQHASKVADRIWQAWWRDDGFSLEAVEDLVRRSLVPDAIPSCVVGLDGETFAGTASLVAQDMDARPNYTPWIAGVWVDPAYRGTGLGSRLVMAAAKIGFDDGVPRIHLYTDPANGPFYEKMGWTRIEADVEGSDIFAMDAGDFSRRPQSPFR